MPSIPDRRQQPSSVNPQIPIPGDFPLVPREIIERFPSATEWQKRLNEFWGRTTQALQEAQKQTADQANSQVIWTVDRFLVYTTGNVAMPMFSLDDTGIKLGDVLVVNTPERKVYIGAGEYADDNTPFYIDTEGNFSLGASLTWDAETDTLTIIGIINATSGTIGGFDIGPDYIRDTANSFGLASTVTGGDDVRFWAGDTFANRASAPFRITESGIATATFLQTGSIIVTANSGLASGSGVLIGGTLIAPVGYANGVTLTLGLEAAGNGDLLTGISCNATYRKSTFTGLTATGAYVRMASSTGSGAISNAYGVYIDTVNVGTNNFGLYVATTAESHFGGAVFASNNGALGASFPGSSVYKIGAMWDGSALCGLFNYGAAPSYVGGRAGGTKASPSATLSGERIAAYSGMGYDTTNGWGNGTGTTTALLGIFAGENFAAAAQGSYVTIEATPNGSATSARAEVARFLSTGVRIASLAGVGTRTVVADASGNLSAP